MVEASSELSELAARYWAFECESQPFTAIMAGEPTESVVLFRPAIADVQAQTKARAALLSAAEALDANSLGGQEKTTLALLWHELSAALEQSRIGSHLRPWLYPAGPDFNTVFFANQTALLDEAAASLYVARLRALPHAMAETIDTIRAGYESGIRYPKVVLIAACKNLDGLLSGPIETSPWMGPFRRSPLAKGVLAARAQEALEAIRTELRPALSAYAEFLKTEMMAGARESLSCADGPFGEEYYRAWVRHFTTLDDGPEKIHELGISEVARLRDEMAQVADQAGFSGDLKAYQRFLASDLQFIAPSKERLRESLEALAKRVDSKIPAFFARIPRATYGVDLIPEEMSETMPAAYAQPGPADGAAAGIFWANSLPAKCPSYLHVPLVVHEAWPGHLMHIALIQELELPAFRRHGAVKYTAYVEGWALYCEGLAEDMGLYQTPHQHYGRLEMEMWRAVRLVVDTGIHWGGWSRDRAIAYMREALTLDIRTIEAEVDRYAALPGQALAYQIGNLRIRAARRRAEQTLGARFSHRGFHDAIIGAGAVTMPVLDQVVDEWIARSIATR